MEQLQRVKRRRTQSEIVTWMRAQVADILDVRPEEIDPHRSLLSYGLDSSAAIGVTERLSSWLGFDVDPALLLDHPTIHGLASRICGAADE